MYEQMAGNSKDNCRQSLSDDEDALQQINTLLTILTNEQEERNQYGEPNASCNTSSRGSKTLSDVESVSLTSLTPNISPLPCSSRHENLDLSSEQPMNPESLLFQPEEEYMQLTDLTSVTSAVGPSKSSNKVGLDHLDNLCRLLEQLGDLKEKNQKLQKRVEYLEDIKVLHDIHKKSCLGPAVQSCAASAVGPPSSDVQQQQQQQNKKVKYNEESEVVASKQCQDTKQSVGNKKSKSGSRFKHGSKMRSRLRSKSVGNEDMATASKAKSSKWTKMKEAFGWEKSDVTKRPPSQHPEPTVSERSLPVEGVYRSLTAPSGVVDVPQLLDVPFVYRSGYTTSRSESMISDDSMTDDNTELSIKEEINRLSVSPVPCSTTYNQDRLLNESDQQNNLLEVPVDHRKLSRQSSSSPSSSVGVTDQNFAVPSKKDGRQTKDDVSSNLKTRYVDKDGRKYKSAWFKVRDMIHTKKDGAKLKKKPDSGSVDTESLTVIDVQITPVTEDDVNDFGSDDVRKISIKSAPEHRRPSASEWFVTDDRDVDALTCHRPTSSDRLNELTMKKKSMVLNLSDVDDHDDKKARILSRNSKAMSMMPSPTETNKVVLLERSNSDSGPKGKVKGERLRDGSSQRPSKWRKVKRAFVKRRGLESIHIRRSQSVPASPSALSKSSDSPGFNYDVPDTPDQECLVEDNVMNASGSTVKADDPVDASKMVSLPKDCVIGKKRSDQRFSMISSPGSSSVIEELQKNISDDFSKKMEEWERMKSTGYVTTNNARQYQAGGAKAVAKKDKGAQKPKCDVRTDGKQEKEREKAFQWVEKELHKIEREKDRLGREKVKFLEREARLEKLRGSMGAPSEKEKRDILIRTSAGEFRFEGISKSFTKRLYEWEEKKGVVPEYSTIALLSSGNIGKGDLSARGSPSRSEGSLVDAIQSSQHSSSIRSVGGSDKQSLGGRFSPLSISEPRLSSSNEAILSHRRHAQELPTESIRFRSNAIQDFSEPLAISDDYLWIDDPSQQQDDKRRIQYDSIRMEAPEDLHRDRDDSAEFVRSYLRGDFTGRCAKDETYPCLWDENMVLLDKLKLKEAECKQLEESLQDLDARLEEMTSKHTQEVETYKQRLWEVNESLFDKKTKNIPSMVTELKTKIDELESNVDKLKSERQNIESTFNSYRRQQNTLAESLVKKMQELHKVNLTENDENGTGTDTEDDLKEIMKINELTSQLVNQAKELEESMQERNELIRDLRWKVLDKSVANIKLHSKLEQVADKKRRRKEQYKTWSHQDSNMIVEGNRQDDCLEVTTTGGADPKSCDSTVAPSDDGQLNVISCVDGLSNLPMEINAKIRELKLELNKFQITRAKSHRKKRRQQEPEGDDVTAAPCGRDTHHPSSYIPAAKSPSGRYVRRRPRGVHTNVSKATALSSSSLGVSSSESSGCRENRANATRTRQRTSDSPRNDGAVNPDDGNSDVASSSSRKACVDESLGISCRLDERKNVAPITRAPKRIEPCPDDEDVKRNGKLVQIADCGQDVPMYTLYVRNPNGQYRKKRVTLPEVSCTINLSGHRSDDVPRKHQTDERYESKSPALRSKSSGQKVKPPEPSPIDKFKELTSKMSEGPKSPPPARSPAVSVKETRVNVRELAARYDKKISQLKKTPPPTTTSVDLPAVTPTSPNTRTRRAAKDDFLFRSDSRTNEGSSKSDESESFRKLLRDEDNSSLSSVCEVMRRTAENCRENRQRGGGGRQRIEQDDANVVERMNDDEEQQQQQQQHGKQSFFDNLRLRKNKKSKKDELASVKQLCRQSLYLDVGDTTSAGQQSPGPRSCPASPETKAKNPVTIKSNRPNWLQRLKSKS